MKTALVTGGARGIGLAISRRLAADGFRVAVHYNSSQAAAEQLAAELSRQDGLPHLALRADLAERSQVEELFRQAGPVDVLVNNAGIAQQKLFSDITPEEWRRMFAVDVEGVFHCCQCALPYMIHRKAGIGLTKALAKELGPSGIRVNCVAPGVIRTEMNAHLSGEDMEALREETPLCRIGEPEEVADAVSFLAGEGSRFVTGQILAVSGGFAE